MSRHQPFFSTLFSTPLVYGFPVCCGSGSACVSWISLPLPKGPYKAFYRSFLYCTPFFPAPVYKWNRGHCLFFAVMGRFVSSFTTLDFPRGAPTNASMGAFFSPVGKRVVFGRGTSFWRGTLVQRQSPVRFPENTKPQAFFWKKGFPLSFFETGHFRFDLFVFLCSFCSLP